MTEHYHSSSLKKFSIIALKIYLFLLMRHSLAIIFLGSVSIFAGYIRFNNIEISTLFGSALVGMTFYVMGLILASIYLVIKFYRDQSETINDELDPEYVIDRIKEIHDS